MKYDPQNPKSEDRDWLVCSKGHAGPAVYSALALKGFFPLDWLKTLNQPHTNLPSHCDRTKTPGIDITTGSLGQGLSVAVGVAFGHLVREAENRVYAIVGDGEMQEGQIWEAILLAAHRQVSNLTLFVDSNKVQLDGNVEDMNNLEDYVAKFKAFNWNVVRVDGHDVNALGEAIAQAKACDDKPTAIICDTVKGKGVCWAEGQFNHHIEVTPEMAAAAIQAM
jgi:transketolase